MSAPTRTPLARKAGLSEAIISDIRDGKRPSTLQPDEAVVYDFVTELLHKRQLSDETFARRSKFWEISKCWISTPSPAST